VGLSFGALPGSTATPATTSAPASGFGTGVFGSKSSTGFTLGGTSTGKEDSHIFMGRLE
jgi:nucleoporin p58/p45